MAASTVYAVNIAVIPSGDTGRRGQRSYQGHGTMGAAFSRVYKGNSAETQGASLYRPEAVVLLFLNPSYYMPGFIIY